MHPMKKPPRKMIIPHLKKDRRLIPMNPLGHIIPEVLIPDSEPWRDLLKGDAYQMCANLIVGDQWLEIMSFHGETPPYFAFGIGNTFIDGELDVLLLLPPSRGGRLPRAFQWEDYREVLRPLPSWDKTRWAIRTSKAPYSQCYPRYGFPLYDCRVSPKGDDEGESWKGWTCECVWDDTRETEELERRFSEKRVSGKYPALPDVEDEKGNGPELPSPQ